MGKHDVVPQVNRIILGKEEQVKEVWYALLAGGHVLLEDIPGVGKTTLALAFAKTLDLGFKRVQFTPDVMPGDITGFSVYHRSEESFVYQEGAVFTNLLLADEINRTSPKTQSALLEVMQENKVTAEGVTRPVPLPFFVIATQNPYGSAGTQRLPESQSDRFMIRLSLGYPDAESERQMAVREEEEVNDLTPVLNAKEVLALQEEAAKVYVKDSVADYAVKLVSATRSHPMLLHGASPRASIALIRMARAMAFAEDRSFVTPEDIAIQFPYVIAHRIETNASARMEETGVTDIIEGIVKDTPRPALTEGAP